MDKDAKYLFTTAEIANRIGYSSQSVRNAIKQLGLEPAEVKGKTRLYGVDTANAVAEHFHKPKSFTRARDEDSLVTALRSQIDLLTKQIDIKDTEIQAKNEQLKAKDEEIKSLLDNLTASQKQLADAQGSIKALSASNAFHTLSDNKETLLVSSGKGANEVVPLHKEMSRWEHFKAVFSRKE